MSLLHTCVCTMLSVDGCQSMSACLLVPHPAPRRRPLWPRGLRGVLWLWCRSWPVCPLMKVGRLVLGSTWRLL